MQPDFIIIGAMKCGTSTVNAYFEDHPATFMVKGQEPNFFSHEDRFAQGVAAGRAARNPIHGRTRPLKIGQGTGCVGRGQMIM